MKLPGKRGKKSLLALMSLLAVLAILINWSVDSLRSQNLRRIEEFRRIVAAEGFTTFTTRVISERSPNLYPLHELSAVVLNFRLLPLHSAVEQTVAEREELLDAAIAEFQDSPPPLAIQHDAGSMRFPWLLDVLNAQNHWKKSAEDHWKAGEFSRAIDRWQQILEINESLSVGGSSSCEMVRCYTIREFNSWLVERIPKLTDADLEKCQSILSRIEPPGEGLARIVVEESLNLFERVQDLDPEDPLLDGSTFLALDVKVFLDRVLPWASAPGSEQGMASLRKPAPFWSPFVKFTGYTQFIEFVELEAARLKSLRHGLTAYLAMRQGDSWDPPDGIEMKSSGGTIWIHVTGASGEADCYLPDVTTSRQQVELKPGGDR
ncbi:MAG: hypothetical protein DSY81_02325 [Bacillota bacterium]|nr:MAG: hypothetical protein DSY81_02325 [Bacillota bacterium]